MKKYVSLVLCLLLAALLFTGCTGGNGGPSGGGKAPDAAGMKRCSDASESLRMKP